MGDQNLTEIIQAIKIALAEGGVIINTVNGDSNVAFFQDASALGVTPEHNYTVEMTLTMDAAEENARHFPVDDSVMQKDIAHMVLIDRCPSCHGVWLDGGERGRLRNDL